MQFPRDCTNGTSLGGTTRGILEGYLGWVLSIIDSPSYYIIVCRELMFLFCHTEQRYCDMNVAHSSLNKFMELRGSFWSQANEGPRKLAGNTLYNSQSLPTFRIIA